ncbi:MAG: acyltransferase [Betaproteobacteria bacterium]|nr:MAG: acyltransferase [Betaproteobacteria bacterium]
MAVIVEKEFKTNNFDLLRIFAASEVLAGHTLSHLDISSPPWLIKLIYAFPGVPIFFVISGFLISASYERSSSLKSYSRNRVLRIYPGLWCCVLATILVTTLCGFSFANSQAPLWIISQLAGAIYTPGFLKNFGFGSYNGSLWTIPVELQFYFLLPALYWLTRKGAKDQTSYFWLAWFAFVAIALAASLMFPPLENPEGEPTLQKLIRYSFFPHFFLFLSGVLLQRIKAYESRWIVGKGVYWLVAYLAFYYVVPTTSVTYVPTTLLLGIVTVSMAYTAPGISQKILRGNDISYGVYIYHGLMINILVEIGLTGRAEYFVLLAACTYLAGYVSWIAIERPFLRKKEQTISPTLATEKQENHWFRLLPYFTRKT